MTTAGGEKGIGLSAMAEVLAASLPKLSARDRLALPMALFGPRAVLTTSFGATSAVLLHLVTQVATDVTVLNIRHGYETPETLAFIEDCRSRFPIRLVTIQAPHLPVPAADSEEFDEFQQATKIRPLRQVLAEFGVWFWFSGVMHDEMETRRALRMARVRHGAISIYPILDWTSEQALEYCIRNNLPVNSHYFDPCKGPDQSLECGLHYDALGHE